MTSRNPNPLRRGWEATLGSCLDRSLKALGSSTSCSGEEGKSEEEFPRKKGSSSIEWGGGAVEVESSL